MYPPSPYALSRGSFQTPVTPPTTQPGDSPLQQVCVNQDWLPFIVGALKQLELQATWVVPDDNSLLDVQGRVFDLMARFLKTAPGCGIIPPDLGCFSGSFVNEPYGFVNQTGFSCVSSWVAGTGFQSCHDPVTNVPSIHIERDLTTATEITGYSVDVNAAVSAPSYDITAIWSLNGVTQRVDTVHIITGSGTLSSSTPVVADHLILEVVAGAGTGFNMAFQGFNFCYSGAFPLAKPPLTPFTHTFDFSLGTQQGWALDGPGTWSGSDWRGAFNGTDTVLRLKRDTGSSYQIASVEVFYAVTNSKGQSPFVRIYETPTSSTYVASGNGSTANGNSQAAGDDLIGVPAVNIQEISVAIDAHGNNTDKVTKVVVRGYGPDPF